MKTLCRHHVNLAAQQLLQIGQESPRKERGPAGTDVNQKIDVALLPCLTTACGAEDSYIGCSVPGCNIEDLLPLGFLKALDVHRSNPQIPFITVFITVFLLSKSSF